MACPKDKEHTPRNSDFLPSERLLEVWRKIFQVSNVLLAMYSCEKIFLANQRSQAPIAMNGPWSQAVDGISGLTEPLNKLDLLKDQCKFWTSVSFALTFASWAMMHVLMTTKIVFQFTLEFDLGRLEDASNLKSILDDDNPCLLFLFFWNNCAVYLILWRVT